MRHEAVPRAERKCIVDQRGTHVGPALLRLDPDPGDGPERTVFFLPQHRGVLDRHAVQIHAELDPQLPFAAMHGEEADERLTDAVRMAVEIERGLNKAFSSGETGATEILAIWSPQSSGTWL